MSESVCSHAAVCGVTPCKHARIPRCVTGTTHTYVALTVGRALGEQAQAGRMLDARVTDGWTD